MLLIKNQKKYHLEVIDGVRDCLPSVLRLERHGELARAGDQEVGGLVLVGVGVAADHDGLGPGRDQAGNVLADDGLTRIEIIQLNKLQYFKLELGMPTFCKELLLAA